MTPRENSYIKEPLDMAKRKSKNRLPRAAALVVLLAVGLACHYLIKSPSAASLEDLPAYNGSPYVILDDNEPGFTQVQMTTLSYETYGPLDLLGRCTAAEACIGPDLMPEEARESIQEVYPTGWEQNAYDFISGDYLYNRCHLIGYQLTGENTNERNLITGTRYLNIEGMLPFENQVADYIQETGNHVLYRVTPVFEGSDLLAEGVQMEAYSVEDEGAGICFNVYCYNVQPGVDIDYATGENWLEDAA